MIEAVTLSLSLALAVLSPRPAAAQAALESLQAPAAPISIEAPISLPAAPEYGVPAEWSALPELPQSVPLSEGLQPLRAAPSRESRGTVALGEALSGRAEPAAAQAALPRFFDGQGLRAAIDDLPFIRHFDHADLHEDAFREDGEGNPVVIPGHLEPLLPSNWNKENWSGRVTLHLHSVYSDGTMQPEAVVQAAYDKGVRVLALTDHDTLAGVAAAWRKAKELGIEFHPGAELTARGGVHVGAIDVDVRNEQLKAIVTRMHENRWKKAEIMVQNLNALPELRQKGIVLTMDEVEAKSMHAQGGTIEIPHIARVLVDKGLIEHVDDAYRTYLKGKVFDGIDKYPDPTVDEVLSAIRAAGGKAILNHPYTVRTKERDGDDEGERSMNGEQDRAIEEILAKGFDGIEVYRPSNARSDQGKKRADARVAKYLLFLDKYSTPEKVLVAAPGADFHGTDTHLGHLVVWMPKVLSEQLLAALKEAQSAAISALESLEGRGSQAAGRQALSIQKPPAAPAAPAAAATRFSTSKLALIIVLASLAFALAGLLAILSHLS
jgi:predicted metal-dependent phosphoesterase TrpH